MRNPTPATVAILVLPPFWQEWWFLTLTGLGGLGAMVGVVHFISTQKLQRQFAELKQQEAVEKERARITPDLRHNVFLAFKESVNNVVKHAQASEVKIRLRLTPTTFTLEIEDNGRGPGAAVTKTGRNGLRNMCQRMEDVGGAFGMTPGPPSGTLIRLTAPLGKH